MKITIEYLKRLAEIGYITNTALIGECERNPKLLETINLYEYVSQPNFVMNEDGLMVQKKEEAIKEVSEPVVEIVEEPAEEPAKSAEEVIKEVSEPVVEIVEEPVEIVVEERSEENQVNKKNKKA